MYAQLMQAAYKGGSHEQVIRQFHRWTSIAFTLSVIANFDRAEQPEPTVWVTYLPLLPLALAAVHGPLHVRAAVLSRRARS